MASRSFEHRAGFGARIVLAIALGVVFANDSYALLGGKEMDAAFAFPERLRKEKMKLVPKDKRTDREAMLKAFYPAYTNGWCDGIYIPTNIFQASGVGMIEKVHVISEPDGADTFDFCGVTFGRPMSEQKGKYRLSSHSPGGRSSGWYEALPEPLARHAVAEYETGLHFVLSELHFTVGGDTQEEFERSLIELVGDLESKYIKGRLKGWATTGFAWPISSLMFVIERPNCKISFAIIQALVEDPSKARRAQFKVIWSEKTPAGDNSAGVGK